MMFTRVPVPSIEVMSTPLGLTLEGWAVQDAITANNRMSAAEDTIERVKAGTVTEFAAKRVLPRMIRRARRAETYCTNSGKLRSECDMCAH